MTSGKLHIKIADYRDVSRLTALIRDSYRDVAERFGLTAENCPKHPSNCTEGWIKKDFERGVVYFILERGGTPGTLAVASDLANPPFAWVDPSRRLPDIV